MKRIVFATNNKHKLKEIREILNDKYIVISLSELGCFDDIPETETTLEGNALLKALYVNQQYSIDCFADDTGLEVEALSGRPGVYSARYAGEEQNAENNIVKVLEEMKGETNRKARFRTVIALIFNKNEYYFEGTIEGELITEKHGTNGFGYDPIFVPTGYNQTFAEMPLNQKNKISHRALAVAKLVTFLKQHETD
jgi:XTP/dITP diphosphohydrolase